MASRSEWTPDYINTLVFITIDLSAQHNEQWSQQTEISTQLKILQPPTAQNLQNSIKWTQIEPPRAHNLIEFSIRTINEDLNSIQGRSNLKLRMTINNEGSTSNPKKEDKH